MFKIELPIGPTGSAFDCFFDSFIILFYDFVERFVLLDTYVSLNSGYTYYFILVQDVPDPEIMVAFPVLGDSHNASFVAWTTTPWTLPSNLALCVNASFTYVKVS